MLKLLRYLPALLLAVLSVTFAQAQSGLPKGWQKANAEPPGALLDVQIRFEPRPTTCVVLWMNANALSCDAGSAGRLIFPVTQVYSVRRAKIHNCDGNCAGTKRMLIGAGAGALLGGLILARNGGRAGAFGAMLGAGVGGVVAAGPIMSGQGR